MSFIIQQIVTLSKYGDIAHMALDICHQCYTYIRSFVSSGKENCKKCRRNDSSKTLRRDLLSICWIIKQLFRAILRNIS